MKCIKVGNEIKRVKDSVAMDLVKKGEATYASKVEWRKQDPDWVKRKATNEAAKVAVEKKKAAKEAAAAAIA